MIYKIFVAVIIVIMAIFTASAFIFALAEKHERKQQEKETKENEERAAEIITEANKTKAEARTGDHKRDIDYMASKLHDYATK